jgi:hypothetical protein
MLDPVMWPQRFAYVETAKSDDLTTYELHALNDANLRDVTVSLGPRGAARSVEVRYNDGTTIDMHVRCSNVNGFFLPANLAADIDEPGMAFSANASFEDYVMRASNSTG